MSTIYPPGANIAVGLSALMPMTQPTQVETCAEDAHDWRHDPTRMLPTAPPKERLLCAMCGSSTYRTVGEPPTEINPHDPKTWPAA